MCWELAETLKELIQRKPNYLVVKGILSSAKEPVIPVFEATINYVTERKAQKSMVYPVIWERFHLDSIELGLSGLGNLESRHVRKALE